MPGQDCKVVCWKRLRSAKARSISPSREHSRNARQFRSHVVHIHSAAHEAPFSRARHGRSLAGGLRRLLESGRFQVVSLNRADEISALRAFESTVDFVEVPAHRDRPLIKEFLAAAAASDSPTAGIINADCLLVPQTGFAKRLAGKLDGLVISERISLSQTTLRPTGYASFGFDAFFFPTKAAADIECPDHWRIGDVWWDYWLPLAFQVAGFETKSLPAPMLIHFDHDQTWDLDLGESTFPRMHDFLRINGAGLRHPDLMAAAMAIPTIPKTDDIRNLHCKLYSWLHSRDPLWRPEDGSVDDLLIQILNALSTPPRPVGRGRALLRRSIDILGLRPALDLLGLR